MMPYEALLNVFRSIFRSTVSMIVSPSTIKTATINPTMTYHEILNSNDRSKSLKELGLEVAHAFGASCTIRRMLVMSTGMRRQYREKLFDSETCMLPSFCHTMPNGQETGTFIALDVGGSTFRVALVELNGRYSKEKKMHIRRMTKSVIDDSVRQLHAADFFDWMACKIQEMLQEDDQAWEANSAVQIGLTWSFPIEQTSHRGGKLQGMGKGFQCHHDVIGQDLEDLVETACLKRGFKVRVDAIVNDSSATLLSQAYLDPSTSMGLIVGTGTNAAAYLPTSSMSKLKFGDRPPSWFAKADKVITNTEFSMFGKGILQETEWDRILNQSHQLPDFQPLEYMTTGRYLGELFRLVILEAIESHNFFNGDTPAILQIPYSVDTAILAQLEAKQLQNLQWSATLIQEVFGLSTTPTEDEIDFLSTVAQAISNRATAYLAVAIHALWALQKDTEINLTTPHGTPKKSIACNGSVILKYPRFKDQCEQYIARMIAAGSSAGGLFPTEAVVLQPTDEAAVYGAAVAVALSDAT